MDFLISNIEFENSKKIGDLYYDGQCVKEVNNLLKVRESSDWRFFGKYADAIGEVDPESPIEYDDFFFCLDYDANKKEIVFQTDIIGYNSPYCYFANGVFAMSDDFYALVKTLNKVVDLEMDEQKAREFLLYSEPFICETYIRNLYREEAAVICRYNLESNNIKKHTYNDFKMCGVVKDKKQAADSLYCALDTYFKNHHEEDTKYAIGMSGGLDSRVGAFFANKNGYEINPIFIGRKNNILGMMTNDCKRAEEVNKHLKLKPIKYFDPRGIALSEKLEFEAQNAPIVADNIAQNMGTLEGIDCLINGIIGGEALGALVTDDMKGMSSRKLAYYMINRVSNIPKYRTRFLRRIYQLLPNDIMERLCCFDEKLVDDVLTPEERNDFLERNISWVEEQKNRGLDNINIYHKYFYYRFASLSKYAYYPSFNNTCPSIATYLNPAFIKEMLQWDSELLRDKQVQKELLKQLEGLSSIRSQTVEATIDARSNDTRLKRIGRIIERFVRGGAMVYTQWYAPKDIKKEMRTLRQKSKVLSDLVIRDDWYKADHHFAFGFMKLLEFQRQISN